MGLEHDIGELWVRLERLESAVFRRQSSEASKDDRSHFELVVEVLRGANGRFLAASQIAFAAGIDAGAVRTILYSHKSQFRAAKVGPRRVKWRLENADAPTFGTSQEETALTAGDKYPGFENMNSEAAAEITRLRAELAGAKLDIAEFQNTSQEDGHLLTQAIKERDRAIARLAAWKAEAEAGRRLDTISHETPRDELWHERLHAARLELEAAKAATDAIEKEKA